MNAKKYIQGAAVAAAAVLALPAFAAVAYAEDALDAPTLDTPVTSMAPPVSAPAGDASSDQSVFNWRDVPTNQHIKITRAVFDQTGYQLYANTGETILIPFANKNLYVMKFGQTIGGSAYFVNDGSTPILYLPQNGYLENAADQGSKWYPFSQNYDYTQPVYEGIAPNWDAYDSMVWYPGEAYYGGFWGYSPWGVGIAFSPMPGLCFSFFGQPYYGWGGYLGFQFGHPNLGYAWHNGSGFHGYAGLHGEGFHGEDFHGSNGFHGNDGARAVGASHVWAASGGGRYGSAPTSGRAASATHSWGTASSSEHGSVGNSGGRSFGGDHGSFSGNGFSSSHGSFSGGGGFSGSHGSFGGGGRFGGHR